MPYRDTSCPVQMDLHGLVKGSPIGWGFEGLSRTFSSAAQYLFHNQPWRSHLGPGESPRRAVRLAALTGAMMEEGGTVLVGEGVARIWMPCRSRISRCEAC